MLSVVVPARNGAEMTRQCLATTLSSLRALRLEDRAEFILLDDNSDPALGITRVFAEFAAAAGMPASIFRFKKRQHYTGCFAYGLSRARGNVLFVSNDMRMTPAFLRTVLAVAGADHLAGIIRGCSAHTDSLPQHTVKPGRELKSYEEECEFAESVAREQGLLAVEDPCLSGDAVLIQRSVIDKIGVMDRQFYGYFGDPDYGLRAQRAGLKLVCAKGAWLVHLAEGHIKEESAPERMNEARTERMRLVGAAYALFREKWGPTLPPMYPGVDHIDFARLRQVKRPLRSYEPPLGMEPQIAEVVTGAVIEAKGGVGAAAVKLSK